jgi:hypothetical protein
MKLRTFLIPLLLVAAPKLTFANLLPAINNFLLAAQADLDDTNAERKKIPELNGLSAWVEEAQFRFNNADQSEDPLLNKGISNISSQSYGLRVKPKAWGQRAAEQKILQLHSHQEDAHYNESLNAELSQRYARILELISQQNQTQFLLESEELLGKQVQMNRNLVNSTDFNEENLLDVEIASEQTQDLLALNLHRLNDLQSQLNIPKDDHESLAKSDGLWTWLIDVSHMAKIMAHPIEPQQVPEVIKSRLDLEQAKAENQHKKSTQQLGINLLRFQVDESDDLKKELKLSFMVGVNIPLGSENFQSTETRHDMYDAHFKLHDSVYTTTHGLDEKRAKMKWLLEEWQVTQKQINKLKARMQKDYAKINPQLGLALQIEHAKKLKELLDIHQEALTLYVGYLTISGQLTGHPLRNWLHTEIPELRPIASKKPTQHSAN